ncbi:hypothetical protein K435DRAFT_798366 [Dendrothele bispora CBS 962.96]|uniref:DUF6532 domain-containing protein n=1 Tax=Dendrothele bispora (strain CBS 962.96) TaxID=1314807 RepID=A0A4S8LZG8_DENBC|nr:hypothetical protein K435DRAFT_798366 [Dendrothele bispora CBS 962.96]
MAPKSLSEILAMGNSTGPTQKQSNADSEPNSLPPRGSKQTAMAKKAPATETFEFKDDNDSNNAFPVIAPPFRPSSVHSVRSTSSAISEDGIAIPETDATISDASSAFNMFEDEDEDEDDNNEPQTAKEPKLPNHSSPSHASTPKHSENASSHSGPRNSANSQAVSPADPRNHGWDTSTYMTYPGSGKRYISKKGQPVSLGKVLSDAIDIALGLFLFRNAYPEPAEQQQMITLSLNTACTKHKQHHIANRIEQDREYRELLVSYIMGRITHMRSKVKETAAGLVGGLYEFMKLAPAERSTLVRGLLDRLAYVFPLNNPMQPSTWRSNEPYRHPAIIEVLKQAFFSQDSKSIGKRYEDNFQSTSPTDPAKEIPMPMLALAGVAIFAALKEWASGTRVNEDFAGIVMSEEYEKHISLCKGRIIGEDGSGRTKYHNMTTRLYREAKGLFFQKSRDVCLSVIVNDNVNTGTQNEKIIQYSSKYNYPKWQEDDCCEAQGFEGQLPSLRESVMRLLEEHLWKI